MYGFSYVLLAIVLLSAEHVFRKSTGFTRNTLNHSALRTRPKVGKVNRTETFVVALVQSSKLREISADRATNAFNDNKQRGLKRIVY